MAGFESFHKGRDSSSRRGSSSRSFGRSRDGGRSSDRRSRPDRGGDRGSFERTKVICSSCKKECEVPFKPTSNKPVYCDDCFAKKGKGNSGISKEDFDMLNTKLDKIIKHLKIE